MKKYIWLSIILLLGSFFIYIDPFQSAPYSPDIETEEKEHVEVTEGSYCWGTRLLFQCVDKIYTGAIDMAADAEVIEVHPEEVLTIDYSRQPIEDSLELTLWESESEQKRIEVNNFEFKAPSVPGEYVYLVQADWNKGDGNHAFRLRVTEEAK